MTAASQAAFSGTALCGLIKACLEAQGFEVKGEVCGTGVAGIRDVEPPIVVVAELKLWFDLNLFCKP
ncbi:hypothetical protein [Sphingomonas sp. S2-65]|uniref:hypothetical protein n=1 Tax=Sphingomonas sp. S2-65 TaxID=2903960 RepID=UPI001F38E259|nr:hypothetical protein [Sphingomonas sp. S2-65]UYY58147.1 hypothetical protein LZ586_16010 [Sphingomonas sp. S2-65]